MSPPIFLGEVSVMLGSIGAHGGGDRAAAESDDARSAALQLMSEALARLDGDSSIPAIIAAHLQSAIDALWTSGADGPPSSQLH